VRRDIFEVGWGLVQAAVLYLRWVDGTAELDWAEVRGCPGKESR
jgi:hypothetical protein